MSDNEEIYPAECHFRIVAEATSSPEAGIREVLSSHKVTSPLEESNTSSSGRYRSLGVSVKVETREEHFELDRLLREQDGVRLVM